MSTSLGPTVMSEFGPTRDVREGSAVTVGDAVGGVSMGRAAAGVRGVSPLGRTLRWQAGPAVGALTVADRCYFSEGSMAGLHGTNEGVRPALPAA